MSTPCKALNILLLTTLVLLSTLNVLNGPLFISVLRGNCGRTLVLICIGIGIVVGLASYAPVALRHLGGAYMLLRKLPRRLLLMIICRLSFPPAGNLLLATLIMVMVLYLRFPDRRMATSIMLIGILGVIVPLLCVLCSELVYETNVCRSGAFRDVTLRTHALMSPSNVLTGDPVSVIWDVVSAVLVRLLCTRLVSRTLTLRPNVMTVL